VRKSIQGQPLTRSGTQCLCISQAVLVALRRRPERFRSWPHDYRAGRRWPLAGFVAIVGSQAQDTVFLECRLVERLGSSAVQLGTVGELNRWQVDQEALREELRDLAGMGALSDEDRVSIDHAIELVEYEIGNRTGVAVVPPKTVP